MPGLGNNIGGTEDQELWSCCHHSAGILRHLWGGSGFAAFGGQVAPTFAQDVRAGSIDRGRRALIANQGCDNYDMRTRDGSLELFPDPQGHEVCRTVNAADSISLLLTFDDRRRGRA